MHHADRRADERRLGDSADPRAGGAGRRPRHVDVSADGQLGVDPRLSAVGGVERRSRKGEADGEREQAAPRAMRDADATAMRRPSARDRRRQTQDRARPRRQSGRGARDAPTKVEAEPKARAAQARTRVDRVRATPRTRGNPRAAPGMLQKTSPPRREARRRARAAPTAAASPPHKARVCATERLRVARVVGTRTAAAATRGRSQPPARPRAVGRGRCRRRFGAARQSRREGRRGPESSPTTALRRPDRGASIGVARRTRR